MWRRPVESARREQDGERNSARRVRAAVYLISDVLHLDGSSLLALPYCERRALLDDLYLNGPTWQTPPVVTRAGACQIDCVSDVA